MKRPQHCESISHRQVFKVNAGKEMYTPNAAKQVYIYTYECAELLSKTENTSTIASEKEIKEHYLSL